MAVVTLLMWSGLRVVVEAQSGEATATVHESFGASSEVRISLSNVSGRILVTPSRGDVVDISAVKHAANTDALSKISVVIDRNGSPVNDVHVRTHYDRDSRGDGSVEYTLSVPRRAIVRLSNITGSIMASGLSNDVSVTDIAGNVTVENIDGNLQVHTVNGGIVASLTRFTNDRRVTLYAVSGPVSLTIPRDTGAVVKAHSISGAFSSDFPLTVKSEMIGSHVDGRIGNGDGWISLETVSGSMDLKSSGR
jgi:hypothetical protein